MMNSMMTRCIKDIFERSDRVDNLFFSIDDILGLIKKFNFFKYFSMNPKHKDYVEMTVNHIDRWSYE